MGNPDAGTSLYLLWQEPLKRREGSRAIGFVFSLCGFSHFVCYFVKCEETSKVEEIKCNLWEKQEYFKHQCFQTLDGNVS